MTDSKTHSCMEFMPEEPCRLNFRKELSEWHDRLPASAQKSRRRRQGLSTGGASQGPCHEKPPADRFSENGKRRCRCRKYGGSSDIDFRSPGMSFGTGSLIPVSRLPSRLQYFRVSHKATLFRLKAARRSSYGSSGSKAKKTPMIFQNAL